jgi:hypothetical protein
MVISIMPARNAGNFIESTISKERTSHVPDVIDSNTKAGIKAKKNLALLNINFSLLLPAVFSTPISILAINKTIYSIIEYNCLLL